MEGNWRSTHPWSLIYSQRGEGRTAALKIPHKERGRDGGGLGRRRTKRRRCKCLFLVPKKQKHLKFLHPKNKPPSWPHKVEAFFFFLKRRGCFLPSLHQSIPPPPPPPPPSLSWKKMSLKTQTARGANMKGERSAKERPEQCPSFFIFFYSNSCQDQWPRYWSRPKGVHYSSTRGYRPRPRTNTLC